MAVENLVQHIYHDGHVQSQGDENHTTGSVFPSDEEKYKDGFWFTPDEDEIIFVATGCIRFDGKWLDSKTGPFVAKAGKKFFMFVEEMATYSCLKE